MFSYCKLFLLSTLLTLSHSSFVANLLIPESRRGRGVPSNELIDVLAPSSVSSSSDSSETSAPVVRVGSSEGESASQIAELLLAAYHHSSPVDLSTGRSAQSGLDPDFGLQMQLQPEELEQVGLPQLAQVRQAVEDPALVESSSDDTIRCIPKVMQVEETVYERGIKCRHSYQEKCHLTYITDYQPVSEERCETNFKKSCHITFKPMPFNDTVTVCHTPVVRQCGEESSGEDICSTHYETSCETSYNTKEVEQDEPVCVMEVVKNCKNLTLDLSSDPASGVSVEQECEEWPVQKCNVSKKLVKKVEPLTECKKIPREVCVPNNCQLVQGDEVCREEERVQVQNVPEEECDLQPEENCFMEAVLVPKLVPKNNCVQVPKEICVNTKSNPRRVKKPIVKEWCYNPRDLLRAGGL